MHIIDIILLGLIQGLTEFIPVSSSGHLLLFDALRGGDASFEFETLTNIGTLLAAIVYFRNDILSILFQKENSVVTIITLIYTIIPVLVVGFIISMLDISYFQSVSLAIVMLIVVGIAMIIEKSTEQNNDIKKVTKRNGAIIGLLQVFALIPGTSRSAMTILAARTQGFNRELAARFSFIVSIPVVAAAVGLTALKAFIDGDVVISMNHLLVANIASFTSAIIGIHFLLKLLKKYSLATFGLYRIFIGIVLLLLL